MDVGRLQDDWTIVTLPTLQLLSEAQDRTDRIADWAISNEIDPGTLLICSSLVRFREKATATFFRLSFNV